ncbi:MAG: protein rep [Thermoleophilia bacterium]
MLRSSEGGPLHWAGLVTCGSVSACPCCSAKIRAGRAEEIRRGLEVHTGRGGGALFVTLTLPHTRAQGLVEVWDTLANALRRVLSGTHRRVLRERFGVVGLIRATEVTHGQHGWHPHVHLLVLVDEPWADLDRVVEFWRWLHLRWARAVVALGGGEPTLTRGVQVLPCWRDTSAVSRYLAAVSGDVPSELTRGDRKTARLPGHRSPFQLLADAVEHDDQRAWDLYCEWIASAKGRPVIMWSRGLKDALGLWDRSDEEIAEEHDHHQVVAHVTRECWRAMTSAGCTVEAAEVATILGLDSLAGVLGMWGVRAWLDRRGQGPPVLRAIRGAAPTTGLAGSC